MPNRIENTDQLDCSEDNRLVRVKREAWATVVAKARPAAVHRLCIVALV